MPRSFLRAALGAVALLAFALPAGLSAQPASSTPAPAASGAAQVPPIVYRERTLANGMRVYTSRDRSTPNVTVQVWYRVGSKDDPRGRSGFAHLFEHMMFKATRNMPSETMDRLTEDVGGFNNASTWDDFTNYYEVVPANHLQRLLWAESQRMTSLVVDEATFHSERDVVKEELRLRVLAEPYGRLFNFVLPEASFSTHPYMRAGIGSIEDLDAATIDDIRNFHATYYRPDNAALIVVGNFDEAQLDRWIDQYFGGIARPSAPLPRVTVTEPERSGPRSITAYAPNVPLPAVVISWPAPPASSEDAAALDVLDAILSAGDSSRLYNSLVYEQQIAAQIFSDADLREQPGMFYIGAVMASGKTPQEGEAALRAQVAALRDGVVTAAELTEARNELVADAVRERETIDGRAFALGYALMIDGNVAAANDRIAALQRVTAEDVQRVARRYLAEDRRVVIHYMNESERPAGQTAQAAAPAAPVASPPYTGPVTTLAPEGQREAPPAIGAPVTAELPRPAERTLPNGLRVIVARSSDLPLVTAQLTFRTGATADPQGRAGAMSMMANLVTEGTETRSAQQIAGQTEALGAQLSSSSGWESSTVALNVMTNNLAPALTIMADVARNPTFAQEELDRVRSQSLDELQVALQRPGSIAGFLGSPVLFAGSPYGHVAGGTVTSLPRIERGDLVTLHRTYWRPDNAILVLAGDISPEQGFALAEQAFGSWARPTTALPDPPAVTAAARPRAVAVDLPGTGQSAVVLAGPAVARTAPNYYHGLVATTVLGGGYSARLNREIRVTRGLSYGAYAGMTARRANGLYSASAQTRNDAAPQVVGLVQAELAGMASNPPTPEELAARRSSLIGDFGRDLGQSSGLAGIISNLALFGVDLNEIQVYQARVEGVTPAQVQAFAAEVLAPGRASIIVVGDGQQFLTALRQAHPNLEVIPAAELDLDSPTLRRAAPAAAPAAQ